MLTIERVTKRFGATVAVDDVTLSIVRGEIVGLVGENGAGKTTLMRMVAGEIAADSGRIERPPHVGMVHQHFAIAPELTIAENLALLDPATFRFTSPRRMREQAEATIARSGIELAGVTRRAGELAIGEKAKLELIKALSVDPELLILDEPTSVLTPPEASQLFDVMRRLARDGTAVVFISHKVGEVLEIASRVVVMRRGRVVADSPATQTTADDIARAMVMSEGVAPARIATMTAGAEILRVARLSGEILRDVTLTVHRNQIAAIVGVAGNGQSELAEILRGIRRPASGHLDFRTRRVAFIPEDRTRDGLVAELTIAENLALGAQGWSPAAAIRDAERVIDEYRIRAAGPRQRAGDLSGGNQQKVILARELGRNPELIIAAEPTRGLDIESTRFVHAQLRSAATRGAGVLLITSDLDEAFALGDVIHVIYRGRVSEPLRPDEAAANAGALLAGLR